MNALNAIISLRNNEILRAALKTTACGVLAYYATRALINMMSSLEGGYFEQVYLNKYEMKIAQGILKSSQINISWDDIAGAEDVRQKIEKDVIVPLKNPIKGEGPFSFQPTKGLLLHGPPGCGKTMIAQATAKKTDAYFLNINIADLTDKWYGESQKLATAVFTLASKIEPCIIFIDEIDSLLRQRENSDHEVTSAMKSLFMQHWDGLTTQTNARIVVMGATNRPIDIDSAFQRRLPTQIYIGKPNAQQRMSILKLFLKKGNIQENINLNSIVNRTEGFSGSDLYDLCRMVFNEKAYEFYKNPEPTTEPKPEIKLTTEDFLEALKNILQSKKNLLESVMAI